MCLFLEADGLKDSHDSGLLAFLMFKVSICGLSPVKSGKYFSRPSHRAQTQES